MVYAVIDTNVLVSALFSAHSDSSTVIIRNKIADGEIIPLFNTEILDRYLEKDPKDIVFYEVALSKEGSYLVTGNTKHFPKTPIVVTPAEMLETAAVRY